MRFLADFIMLGRMRAMMVASSLALFSLLLSPVSIVSSASVALVTLRRGGSEGFYVLLCACLSAAVLGFFLFGNFQFALVYGAALWLPIWLIAIVLREGENLSVAVEVAVFLGILGVIGFYLYVDDPALLWNAAMNDKIQPMLSSNPDLPIEDVKQSIQIASHYMTGGVAAGTVYGILFGLFLARYWQSALYNPGGFREEYLLLRVRPKTVLLSIAIAITARLMSGVIAEVCLNIIIVFVVLYTFVGTAILHATFLTMKTKQFMVPFLYISLVPALILAPHMVIIIIAVAIVDAWLDLRSKISNKKEN